MHDDPKLPTIFTRAQALQAGASRHQVAHRVRTGRWRALHRGVYTTASLYDALPVREQHALAVVATMHTRGPEESASHLSAAVLLGCILPLDGVGPVTLTSGDLDAPTRRTSRFVLQVASMPESDRRTRKVRAAGTEWEIRTTAPARTVADNLRHLPPPDGVALGDGALRAGLVRHAGVAAVLDRQALWPYAENGRRALMLLDPRRESWLESFSFVRLHHRGLPMPEPQVTISDPRGRFVARVDGWLAEDAVALEADGREKYLLGPALPADPDLAAHELTRRVQRWLAAEKGRAGRLHDVGAEIARWGTRDITHGVDDVLARIAVARARGDRGRFTGRTAYQPCPDWLAACSPRAALLSPDR